MGKLIGEKNWEDTPLGSIENWPTTLKHTVNIILDHKFPSVIGWGKDLITIHNDAYQPLLGDKPDALGRPFLDVWSEAYDIINPQINKALEGQPCYFENYEFRLLRYGALEKAWFDYSFCPIRDGKGRIRGILNTAVERTEKIRAQRELEKMNNTLEDRVKERTAELRANQEELRSLATQLNLAEEKERHRLAGELHDHFGQLLALCKMKLNGITATELPDVTYKRMLELEELIVSANKYTSELVSELKPPPIVKEEEIEKVLGWLAQNMSRHGLTIGIEADDHEKPLTEEIKIILYQCVRELLFNVIKHAGVSEAQLKLTRLDDNIQVMVKDTGKGFDRSSKTLTPTGDGGFGLFNIQEKIELLGGSYQINSEPGEGTTVLLYAPLNQGYSETGANG